MDAVKFLEESIRMCKSYLNCVKCPFWKEYISFEYECREYINQHPKEYVELVEKWSEEHPKPILTEQADNQEHCVCCGKPIPEGQQVCYLCKKESESD